MASEANGEATVKRKRGPRKRVEPLFITKTEIAQHMGLGDLGTLDTWIVNRTFPPPHSQPGERYAVWLRKHWLRYVETGEWPGEAWPTWKS